MSKINKGGLAFSEKDSPGQFVALQKKLHAVASKKKQPSPEINIGDDPDAACQRFCDQMKIKDHPRKEQVFRRVSKHLAHFLEALYRTF